MSGIQLEIKGFSSVVESVFQAAIK